MSALTRIGGRSLAEQLPDVRLLPGPVYSALASGITALVVDGRVPTETRLPSERELAAALGLSRATVTAAYDALRAGGYLASRTGSGSYVTVPVGRRPSSRIARWSTVGEAGTVLDLSCATLPAPPGFAGVVAEAADALGPYLHGDGYDPAGLAELREAVAARFTARGVATRPEQILITGGALHALDLVLRLLVGPGDRVVTELPTYSGAPDTVRANGGRLVPVPMAADGGWQVDQLRNTLRQTAARIAFLIPDHHNPTGAFMPDDERRAVLAAARQTGTTVVVDESFVDLGFEGTARPAASFDPTVITIGSLSKPVWGGLRVGWIRASTELTHRLAALRASIDLSGPVLEHLVATRLMRRLDDIAAWRRTELRPQRDALVAALARELPQWRVVVPTGGLSLWAELDAPMSTSLSLLAAQAGVVLVPGSRFGVDGTLERFLRLPFALPAAQLDDAVRRIADVWAQLPRTGPAPRPLIVA
ncbi:PLP-dependent aminotransferase family protein [uncultured Jatrophihabitans sp.]|uniref:MocR-like transcription factor YczR n=1 Tax=uncultured Jatrophihabitans sp. TaxID=1610747 RepID=UPI0035CB2ED0